MWHGVHVAPELEWQLDGERTSLLLLCRELRRRLVSPCRPHLRREWQSLRHDLLGWLLLQLLRRRFQAGPKLEWQLDGERTSLLLLSRELRRRSIALWRTHLRYYRESLRHGRRRRFRLRRSLQASSELEWELEGEHPA